MIKSEGIVVEVDAQANAVWVEIPERAAACGSCSSASGCQSGLLGLGGGTRRYQVENRIGAVLGERVSLVVADGTVLRASWFSYLLPAILAICGAFVGQAVGNDPGAIAGTISGLVVGFFYLRWNDGRIRRSSAVLGLDRPQAAACHLSESI